MLEAFYVVGGVLTLLWAVVGFVIVIDANTKWVGFYLVGLAALLVYGGLSYAQFNPRRPPDLSSNEVIVKQFGFESGKAYPLEIGPRVGGAGGESHGSLGLFGGSFAVNTYPASSFPFSFTNSDGSTYMLDIPVSKVTYQFVDDQAAESLTLALDGLGSSSIDCERSDPYWRWALPTRDFELDSCRVPQQFGDWVQSRVESVSVMITRENYQALLGK